MGLLRLTHPYMMFIDFRLYNEATASYERSSITLYIKKRFI